MSEKLRWGLLAAGNIAKAFAQGLSQSETGVLQAVASRSIDKANTFADEFGAPNRHGSYEDLLADPEVDAVYISTPHPGHAEWAIKAARAGKHILCEKPIALNHADAMLIIDAAAENDVFLMEAFMYRCHPQTQRLVELIQEGVIGDVSLIRSTFSFHAGFNPDGRIYNRELGGGGILDVGCYATSMARLVAGTALGTGIAEPTKVKAVGTLAETGVDAYTSAVLEFPGGIIAQVSTGVGLAQDSDTVIYGSKGQIRVPQPWFCSGREGGSSTLIVTPNGGEKQEIVIEAPRGLYCIEADTVAANIANRQAPTPAMSWADTLGNMQTLDQWRAEIGVVYAADDVEGRQQSVTGAPLAVSKDHNMRYGRVAGVDKDVARLVMGCDNQGSFAHASAMFDTYYEAGGNCFDTAHLYGGGRPEKLLGQWIKSRGVRDELALISKGAHSPNCFPEKITEQLYESLERLQVDSVEFYFMHRDNLDVPVGEFVDVLNEHYEAGRIRAFGGSNWSLARAKEANAYAAANGKQGFSAMSNNFSLARMVDPVWAGCIAATDPEYKAWLVETQIANFSWSSQARGFFIPERAHPEKREDEELVRCWYSDDNFQRQARAIELAEKKGVAPINIAGAYLMAQPFPLFALFGPRVLSELRSSLKSLDVELTPDEVAWLNLEA